MDPVSFDVLTRRASLLTGATAGLAALASPLTAAGKKKHKKKKGDVNKLCKTQVAPCEAFINDDPARRACCTFWGTCDVAAFFDCLNSVD